MAFFLHNQSAGFIVKEVEKMTGEQIQKYIKPYLEEMFEGYIVIGFKAGKSTPVMIGHAPHKLKKPIECAKIKSIAKMAMKILETNEEDTQRLGDI